MKLGYGPARVLRTEVGEREVSGGSRQVLEHEKAHDAAHAAELGVVEFSTG